jgi:hypothetical protein
MTKSSFATACSTVVPAILTGCVRVWWRGQDLANPRNWGGYENSLHINCIARRQRISQSGDKCASRGHIRRSSTMLSCPGVVGGAVAREGRCTRALIRKVGSRHASFNTKISIVRQSNIREIVELRMSYSFAMEGTGADNLYCPSHLQATTALGPANEQEV